MPAAPAPAMAMRTCGSFLPTTRSAFVSAASTTIAVPCWSSWNTGMSSSPRSRRSTSKQRGALMSSRLMPPNPGAISCTARTISSTSCAVEADRPGVDAGEPLEQDRFALHDGQRGVGADVAQAEHGRAVGDHGHRVALDGQPARILPVPRDRHGDPPHARGVGHRQIVPVAQRHLGAHLDLAAQVQQERTVADLVHGHAVDAAQHGDDGLGVIGISRGAGDVYPQPVVPPGGHVERRHHTAGLLHRPRDLAHGAAAAGHLEPHGNGVGDARRHRHVGSRLSLDSRVRRTPRRLRR